jgi:hypothetical protein
MNTDIDEGNRNQFKGTMNDEVLPRRVVLRGALAMGCGLLLPAALFGCDSKKGENSSGAAPAGSPTPSPDAAAPSQTGKMTQTSVQYQTQPKNGQKCDGCLHFIAGSNSCKLVEGQISPDGWCTQWFQKA